MKRFGTRKLMLFTAYIFGLLALIMYFLPVIRLDFSFNGSDSLGGIIVGFGAGENGYAPSLYMLAFLLPVIGAVLAVFAFRGLGGDVLPLIATACFLVGGIMFFLPIQTVSWTGLSGAENSQLREIWHDMYHLSFGAIFGGIFSIMAAIFVSAPVGLKLFGISLD